MKALIIYLLPFGLALALVCGLRLAAGPERGTRIAGFAVAAAFLLAWGVAVRPGWFATEPVSRIGHIAGGAALVGLALDFFAAKRVWAALAAGVVVIVSAWASVNVGLWPPVAFDARTGAALVALATAAFLVLARLDVLAPRGVTAPVTLLMLALGVAAVAAAGGLALAPTALILAMAIAGFIAANTLVSLRVGDGFVLGVGAALLAIAWALITAREDNSVVFGLAFLPLMLFADGTARRVPLPKARISEILYPLALAAVCALPLLLAVLVTITLSRP